ncbi:CarboxypepD_reg-like domain-containing protein [Arenibacter nanhaiticus]|uniref:CarboxypepD_reg-like domain-containing protein n=1 Tax=Arenibacter nanhaiticus TaxID=558155 RepID=A0A1M6CAA5_9FLAO|nr:carboxypeptidase-like regulatory domain-containing protein [Arenibacter nanhaiticus]SHI57724.1 CarboxypepD_reg-like domain-containing protein [Arenibacter nanhaiticus]
MQKAVSGKVSEKDSNVPLAGVSEFLKGSTQGTSTDFDGNYCFSDVGKDTILVFSYIGFNSLEIPVSGQATINVALEEDDQLLDEVVVTALNVQRDKESLGYSISQVSSEEVNVSLSNSKTFRTMI